MLCKISIVKYVQFYIYYVSSPERNDTLTLHFGQGQRTTVIVYHKNKCSRTTYMLQLINSVFVLISVRIIVKTRWSFIRFNSDEQ